MKGVKGNADGQQDVEMRRLINNPDLQQQPFEILEQKVSVLEKPEHAQVHCNTGNQPNLP